MFVDSRKSSIVFEDDPSTYEYNICKLERLTDMLIGGKLFQCLIISIIYYQNTHTHIHSHTNTYRDSYCYRFVLSFIRND